MSEMRPFCCHGDSLSGPDGRRRWVLGTLSRHLAKGDHAFKVSIRFCNHVANAAMRGSFLRSPWVTSQKLRMISTRSAITGVRAGSRPESKSGSTYRKSDREGRGVAESVEIGGHRYK